MEWEKLGVVYAPDGSSAWAKHSALQPTPWLREDGTALRVFAGVRDDHGVSRVAWLDLDPADPRNVLAVSETPALDIGRPGRFDDNGVVPCGIAAADDGLRLYYAGYQLMQRVRFLVFGGLAVSSDGGASFVRVQETPVVDRVPGEELFRVIHTVERRGDHWRAWYGAGGGFVAHGERTVPSYDIRTMDSVDGIEWPRRGRIAVPLADGEHRIGRPFVFRDPDDQYRMLFGRSTADERYRFGYATSPDGDHWQRDDGAAGVDVSAEGWDSEMVAYPSVVTCGGETWLFYNGNDMGRTGFGLARLVAW